jgi:hypothetical protein
MTDLPAEALNAAWRRTSAGGVDDGLATWAMAGTSTSEGLAARRELLVAALEAAAPAILLAAVEAALELPGEWRDTAADLDRLAGVAADEGDPTKSALLRGRAQERTDCAARLERAITAALPGELRETGEA